MPKNVMKLLKREANYQRNAFDLSHRHLFTANFGELLPATFIETIPDDYIELRAADLIRAIPMVTSPFLRAKQHIDVWYCPYDYLWSNFTSFITQKSQPTSASLKGQTFIPTEQLNYIISAINGGSSLTDVVGLPYVDGARRLFDLCGYGNYNATEQESENATRVNLFRIAAYNKIWYDEYRQQYYDGGIRIMDEASDDYSTPAKIFNFDDLPCTSASDSRVANAPSGQASDRIREMFQMRYRCWKKDLFTGLMPSQQFGNVSTYRIPRQNIIGLATDERVATGGTLGGTVVASSNAQPLSTFQSLGLASMNIDIVGLRKAEALQIWRERSLTAGNRVSDNFKAHYGSDAYYDDHRCTFLGSVDAPLNIQDIDSSAQIGDGANQGLGDVAGKTTSTLDERVFKFKSHEFGVIVVLFSILPEAEYESKGVDRMNQLMEWEDFYNPVFMDLGLEGVGRQTFVRGGQGYGGAIGYAPRFWGYKQKLDICFDGFHSDQPFSPWASPKVDVVQALNVNYRLPLSVLYVNPSLYDRNFSVAVANSRQCIVDLYFNCDAVRQLSVSGLPNS